MNKEELAMETEAEKMMLVQTATSCFNAMIQSIKAFENINEMTQIKQINMSKFLEGKGKEDLKWIVEFANQNMK